MNEFSEEIKSLKFIIKGLEDDHSRAMDQIIEENKRKVSELENERLILKEEMNSLADV